MIYKKSLAGNCSYVPGIVQLIVAWFLLLFFQRNSVGSVNSNAVLKLMGRGGVRGVGPPRGPGRGGLRGNTCYNTMMEQYLITL